MEAIEMETNINQRIDLLIEHLARGRQKEFADKINSSPGTISNIIGTRKVEPGSAFIVKILHAYPQINSDWLLVGNGEMLRNKTGNNGDFGRDTVERLQSEIAREREEKRMLMVQNSSLLELLGKPLASERAYVG